MGILKLTLLREGDEVSFNFECSWTSRI